MSYIKNLFKYIFTKRILIKINICSRLNKSFLKAKIWHKFVGRYWKIYKEKVNQMKEYIIELKDTSCEILKGKMNMRRMIIIRTIIKYNITETVKNLQAISWVKACWKVIIIIEIMITSKTSKFQMIMKIVMRSKIKWPVLIKILEMLSKQEIRWLMLKPMLLSKIQVKGIKGGLVKLALQVQLWGFLLKRIEVSKTRISMINR
jgi:hypothetical protein